MLDQLLDTNIKWSMISCDEIMEDSIHNHQQNYHVVPWACFEIRWTTHTKRCTSNTDAIKQATEYTCSCQTVRLCVVLWASHRLGLVSVRIYWEHDEQLSNKEAYKKQKEIALDSYSRFDFKPIGRTCLKVRRPFCVDVTSKVANYE